MPAPIIYIMNTEYPNTKAHSIQVTKIIYSLSQRTHVTFICNKITTHKDKIHREIKEKYGIEITNTNFLEIPKKKLTGMFFLLTLIKIASTFPENAIFYTRSYNIAKRLVKFRYIHKRKVILESHKKNGYYKEDKVTNSRYSRQRARIEASNEDRKILEKIYRKVDGIAFTSNNSRKIVSQDLGISNTAFIWHPLIPRETKSNRDKQLVYSGSLSENKLIELLLDALAQSKTRPRVDLIGGAPGDIERVRNAAADKEVSECLNFRDRVPHSELPGILTQYKYGLSLMEGLKVADYVECGLIPVIPKIAMYQEIFSPDETIFFEPDDPVSLGNVLDCLESNNISITDKILKKYSVTETANRIFELIENC